MEQHFLIVFDESTGAMREEVRGFTDVAEALGAYRAAERRYEDSPRVQVVLVAADSLDAAKLTHPNFWGRIDVTDFALGAVARKR